MKKTWDCIIIGGGPAGLTAGLYLARYRRNVIIYDTFNSRASRIPRSHNYPGFPNGITGIKLLDRLRQQLACYEVSILPTAVEKLECIENDYFAITSSKETKQAKNVILATGVQDIEPQLPNLLDGIKRGLIRHCPVCDAFEVINKKIAVIGEGKSGLGEALFLRDYSKEITLLTLGKKVHWTRSDLQKIHQAKINIMTDEIVSIKLSTSKAKITLSENRQFQYDVLYSALGCVINSQLAKQVGAKHKGDDLIVNAKQQTSIKGLYAVGDIIPGLNQICVATSQAAIAATAIHKTL